MSEQLATAIIREHDGHLLATLTENPKYLPTVRSRILAEAIKALGFAAWNPKTGKNW